MKRIVILGGGRGGAVAAKRLSRWSREGEVEVVLVDRSPAGQTGSRARGARS